MPTEQTTIRTPAVSPAAHLDDGSLTEETVRTLASARREPDWVRDRRLQAYSDYQQLPLPDVQAELWRRTSLSLFPIGTVAAVPTHWGRNGQDGDRPFGLGSRLGRSVEERGAVLIQRAGGGTYLQVHDDLKRSGVILCDLNTAVREHASLVQKFFMSAEVPAESTRKFDALHGAFWTSGTFIYVPRNVAAKLPLRTITQGALGSAQLPHTLIVADEGAEVTVVEEHISPDGEQATFSQPSTEIYIASGASVRFGLLQELGSNVRSLGIARAYLRRNAQLRTFLMSFGGRVTKTMVESYLIEPGAQSYIYGLAFGDRRQKFDQFTLQDHFAPHTVSDLLYKGAFKDQAESVYLGLIKMRKPAQQSNAFQTDRNLLLTGKPHADSIPVLEIEANDVKCSHAAAVGPIDREGIFYLQSRGIDRAKAERMLVEAFFAEVSDRLGLAWLQRHIETVVDRKMG
ncbi:MAG: Fe-S cluster assembly protein SufD [Chloroflexi bacterium]|nr:Fe-S cluster assembly protein SufD [Chloroflexota bacterium]